MKVIRRPIYEFNESENKEIDVFIELNNGTVFHEIKFNRIVSEVFKTSCFYFVAYNGNDLIGICPVHTIKKGVVKLLLSSLSSKEIPYGGWIFDKSKTTLQSLINNTKLYFNESLTCWSTIQVNNEFEKIRSVNLLRFYTVIMPLRETIDDIFNSAFKSKQKNKIKRAQKLGVIVENISRTSFQQFTNLSDELKEKVGMPIGNPEFYKKVMEAYINDDKIVCLAAKYCEQYISSMVLLANKNYTIAWIAGRKDGLPNNLYQNELLFWESIVWAKKFGSMYFDLCGLDETRLPQLARIKLSFSKEIVPFYMYSKKNFLFRILNKLQNVFFN